MLGASDTKGEAVKKRKPVWEKEDEKLWLLETKRENPKGKIRDNNSRKRGYCEVAGAKSTPSINVMYFLLHSCRWACPEMAPPGRSAFPLGEEQYARGSSCSESVTNPFGERGFAGGTFQPTLSCH